MARTQVVGIPILGPTGCGKSLTTEILTGKTGRAAAGSTSVTSQSSFLPCLNEVLPNHVVIDTKGFFDTHESNNADVVTKILASLLDDSQKQDLLQHKLVVCLEPTERAFAFLAPLASFLVSLFTSPSDLPKSTLVILRQAEVLEEAKEPCTPARQDAVRQVFSRAGVPNADGIRQIAYTSVNRLSAKKQTKYARRDRDDRFGDGLLFENEIADLLSNEIQKLVPFQLVKVDSQCQDCGKRADRRVLQNIQNCHGKFVQSHDLQGTGVDRVTRCHVGSLSYNHRGHKQTKGSHWTLNYQRRWTCCNQWKDNGTCHPWWTGCQHWMSDPPCQVQTEHGLRCSKCGTTDSSVSCIEVCVECGQTKGTSGECPSGVEAEHDIIDIAM